jgi:hypothetical protein
MSIEQKIAAILAESKAASVASEVAKVDEEVVSVEEEAVKPAPENENPDNKRNNVVDQKQAEGGTSKTANKVTAGAAAPEASHLKSVKEDVDALMAGEELSEEFREKAETIFEAAVMSRVHAEVARIEEEFAAKLEEGVAQKLEGIVEQVDGYLGYIAEQWMKENELALNSGMKSEITEGFINGLKDLFAEHYIEVPEERFDVLGEMEAKMSALEEKLNEQVELNVAMTKTLAEQKRGEIVKTVSEGLTDTESEKFMSLVEELSYETAESFESKVKTIRENYFTTKAGGNVTSIVTDTPVETLTEEKKVIDPVMSGYLSVLNKNK